MLCTRRRLGDEVVAVVASRAEESAGSSSNVACSIFSDEDLAARICSVACDGRRGDDIGLDCVGVPGWSETSGE